MRLVRWEPRNDVRRWTPLHEMNHLQDEMNRIFGWAFGPAWSDEARNTGWVPEVDVEEDGKSFRLRADLPGIPKEEIEIAVDGEVLTISGERKSETKKEEGGYYRMERSSGKFQRSLTLPNTVDSDKIEARYHDGVLEIVMPKSETLLPKKVKVQ